METIANDSIRLKIAFYYDVEYEIIKTNELEHYQHYTRINKVSTIKKF